MRLRKQFHSQEHQKEQNTQNKFKKCKTCTLKIPNTAEKDI